MREFNGRNVVIVFVLGGLVQVVFRGYVDSLRTELELKKCLRYYLSES